MKRDTIVCMDALELMHGLEPQSVDAVITDPPYNITHLDFEQAIDWPMFWSEARRVSRSKRSPVILFSQQPFTTDLIMSNRKAFRYEIIMEKTMPVGFLNANHRPLQAHENMLVFGDMEPEYNPVMEWSNDIKALARKRTTTRGHYGYHAGKDYADTGSRYPRSVWRFAQRNTAFANTVTLHPTQKALACLERLVLTYTQPDDVVLDPFCGSGTTALAARNTGRHWIAGDNDAGYVEIARQRLAQPYTLLLFENLPTDNLAPAQMALPED